jgi:hypothetical protein
MRGWERGADGTPFAQGFVEAELCGYWPDGATL